MVVEAFTPHHHWRICYQLLSEPGGKTFAAYIGVIEPGETHNDFSPTLYRGGGSPIPDSRKQKVSYMEAMGVFSNRIVELQNQGYIWRS